MPSYSSVPSAKTHIGYPFRRTSRCINPLTVRQHLDVVENHAATRVCEAPRKPHKRHDSSSLHFSDLVKGCGRQKAVRHPLEWFPDQTRRSVEEDWALPVPAVRRRCVPEKAERVQLELQNRRNRCPWSERPAPIRTWSGSLGVRGSRRLQCRLESLLRPTTNIHRTRDRRSEHIRCGPSPSRLAKQTTRPSPWHRRS